MGKNSIKLPLFKNDESRQESGWTKHKFVAVVFGGTRAGDGSAGTISPQNTCVTSDSIVWFVG